jgi:hypothetical protein
MPREKFHLLARWQPIKIRDLMDEVDKGHWFCAT